MSKYLELKAQISQLQAQAERLRQEEVEAVVAQIRQQILEYGLTPQDLGLAVVKRGRGKPPNWIAGKNRERFLIVR
jgi:DNA-binding protein H-NS